MDVPRSLPRTVKRQRTRSPLSLWLVLSSAACAAVAAAAASPPSPVETASINLALEPRLRPRTADMAPLGARTLSADYGTTVAFPTGVLGLEEVGAELGHVARSGAADRTDAEDPNEPQRDDRSLAGLHVQREKRQGTTATSTTSATATQASSTSIAQSGSATPTSSIPSSDASTAAWSSSASASASETASAPSTTTSGVPSGYQLPQPFESVSISRSCPSTMLTIELRLAAPRWVPTSARPRALPFSPRSSPTRRSKLVPHSPSS